MVASSLSPEPPQDVFLWLYSLPLAPEYRPTLAEFQDPIAYIYKIEKEASQYGICKIVPPVPPCSRRTVIANFNRSLLARRAVAGSSDSKQVSTFTTRQQQIGLCPRKPRPVQKPVWQSGELYTFQEFEAKAKNFERSYLKKCCKRGSLSALEVETLYWKATADKPFSVEYANDMPGSAFPVVRTKSRGGGREAGEGLTVGDTAWNMRGVSRAKGSLLRFMKEEIPGVTSPMIYMAMLLSWFAWHVEDHDLHSLNYLHMGAGKTWYGVPRDAAVAFEEVVRVQGYGGEVNPLVTFATLGEKTTVMSPEVFISAGIPCCRLVQNAGEFVVTFPRAYHTGFSHGFNCGEAANIATSGWLKVANDAAVRRASINYPPMVSHVQLLYDLALELCSRERTSINIKPRSSRLKNKKKNEGETLVKELFVQNFKQNSDLLHTLSEGYSVVLLPENSADISVCSDLRVGSQLSMKPRMTLASYKYDRLPKASKELGDDAGVLAAKQDIEAIKGFYSVRASRNFSLSKSDYMYNLPSMTLGTNSKMENSIQSEALPDQRLFSCVMCGILTFACVAVIQPREAASRYLMSADCSFFNDWTVGFGGTHTGLIVAQHEPITSEENPCSRTVDERIPLALRDTPDQSIYTQFRTGSQNNEFVSDPEAKTDTSALDLLASAYGNQSESEEDHAEPETDIVHGRSNSRNFTAETKGCDNDSGISPGDKNRVHDLSVSTFEPGDGHISDFYELPESKEDNGEFRSLRALGCLAEFEAENLASTKSIQLQNRPADAAPSFEIAHNTENARIIHSKETVENADAPLAPRFNEDCSRMHAFCLEHAVEVKQQLQPIGGVVVFLFCHPEYSKIESEAKLVAKELGLDYIWNDISFRVASKKDEERILSALDSEEAIPSNGDWTVKLGINLFHSVNLSRSTFYSKQMPYNSVIYSAFGRSSLASSPKKSNVYERSSKQKEIVAGKWCGKVWMSNQVHPFLSQNNLEEQEQERNFTNWPMPDENVQKRQKLAETQTKRPSRKISRKMKIRPDYGSTKKMKCIDADNSLVDISHRKLPRTRRSKQPRVNENQDAISDDFLEDNFRLQHYRLLGRNEDKGIERDSAHLGIVTRNNVPQEQRRKLRGKQGTMIERDDSVSADSLRFTSCKESGRIPVSWQPKSFEKENSPSNDSEKHGTVSRGKQTENVERDDAISYNLPAGGSLKQYRRMRRGKRTKFAERGPKMSISGNDSHHRTGRISRGQQMIYAETNEAFSDDSFEHNCQSNKRISISKTTKFANSDNSSSCSSLENNSTQVHGKGPCSRPVKFVASEDVRGSYGSSDDDSDLQLRKIPPSRQQTESTGMEVEVSYDNYETIRECCKLPGNHRESSLDREDSISYDSMDNNFQEQPKRMLRSRQKKQPQMIKEPETSLQEMLGKGTVTRKGTSLKMKQGTPRFQSDKSELNSEQFDSYIEEETDGGPRTRLRNKIGKCLKEAEVKPKVEKQSHQKRTKTASSSAKSEGKARNGSAEYKCDVEGCTMSLSSKQELALHKRNICPVKGCGKKFFSHKYLVQHRRVHMDDRPLKCPWKGCKMTFKWSWARKEHIRVHTGARPYLCAEEGCGQTFRFVSDFSRHKRKTGHSTKKSKT